VVLTLLRMSVPGAETSTHGPYVELGLTLSDASVFATQSTFGYAPGVCTRSLPVFPAAATTIAPREIA